MNRKKFFVIVALVLILGLLYGIHLIRENYQLGRDFYNEANRMSVQTYMVAEGIGDLEEKFKNNDLDDLRSFRHGFDFAMQEVYLHFGSSLLDDVDSEYYDRFEEIYNQAVLEDRDNQKLIKMFTDPEEAKKLSALKEQLEFMATTLMEFGDRYTEMSEWDRYFTSWSNERKILTEKLRMPESLAE